VKVPKPILKSNSVQKGEKENLRTESEGGAGNTLEQDHSEVAHLAEHNKCLQHQVCRLQSQLLAKARQLEHCCNQKQKQPQPTQRNTQSRPILNKPSQQPPVHGKGSVKGCQLCRQHLCKGTRQGHSTRFEDHVDLNSVHLCQHVRCLQRQVCHLKLELEQMSKKTPNMLALRSKMKQMESEMKHLESKCDSLLEQKKCHLDKICQLQKQVDTLLQGDGDQASKVKELIKNIESQRDSYKGSVEKLIQDLQSKDKGKIVNELKTQTIGIQTTIEGETQTRSNDKVELVNSFQNENYIAEVERVRRNLITTENELENCNLEKQKLANEIAECRNLLEHYRVKQTQTSPKVESKKCEDNHWEKEKQSLNDRIDKFRLMIESLQFQLGNEKRERQTLQSIINNLKSEVEKQKSVPEDSSNSNAPKTESGMNKNSMERISFLENQLEKTEETLQRYQELVRDNSNKTYELNTQLMKMRQELNQSQKSCEELKVRLDRKEEVMKRVNEDNEDLLSQLEETRAAHNLLKSQLSHKSESLKVVDDNNASLERRVSEYEISIAQLERKLEDRQGLESNLKSKMKECEETARNLRIENENLRKDAEFVRDSLNKVSDDSQEKSDKVRNLESELKRYIGEVKRVEEVLMTKETDRRELLRQYEELAREMSTYESVNRSLEMQAANLNLEVRSREDDLKAAKARCDDLEKYLEEILQQNEQFRLQTCELNTKLDLLTSDLKENRITRDAVLSDLDSVNELAVKLNSEKVELLARIGAQNNAVEGLQGELVSLREQLLRAMATLEDERHRARTLQDMVVSGGPALLDRETVIRSRELGRELREEQQETITVQKFTSRHRKDGDSNSDRSGES